MLGAQIEYAAQYVRPTKRPRGLSFGGPGNRGDNPYDVDEHDADAYGAPGPSGMGVGVGSPSRGPAPSNQQQRGEDKNNRKLSCKECRRLKLKCDRNFPCQSCVKRGCGTLCPDGALTSGRGSRFILAGAEQLHDKIFQLGERMRQLEEALEVAHAKTERDPHPLLAPELLKIKTAQELYGASGSPYSYNPPGPSSSTAAAAGAGATGAATGSGGPQKGTATPADMAVLARDEMHHVSIALGALSISQPPYAEGMRPNADAARVDLSAEHDIVQLSVTFPFPWAVDVSIRAKIRDALPPVQAEALRLCEVAKRNALWQFNLDASETFIPNLVNYCYTTPIEALSPRRLALLLMYLSIGSIVDLKEPLKTGALKGEAYHHLARAAVCEIPLMEEPDFDVLHALFFMIWYHLIFSDNKKAVGYAWNLMGFVAKLAQGLALHREKPQRKAIPEEHEKRRGIFWELINMDCRMSLSLGRPPSVDPAYVGIKMPSCIGPGLCIPPEEILYHQWKHEFYIACLTPMLQSIITLVEKDATHYKHVLCLDNAAREFPVPELLNERVAGDGMGGATLVMHRSLVTMSREIALLQLHRMFFVAAMGSTPVPFDISHPYAPSVLATYLGAARFIATVEKLFDKQRDLSVRFLHFWFNSFSAAVTLALLILRAPRTALAEQAFRDLERACILFRSAADILPFCKNSLNVLDRLHKRSREVLQDLVAPPHHRPQVQMFSPPQRQPIPAAFYGAHLILVQEAERIRMAGAVGWRGVRPECAFGVGIEGMHTEIRSGVGNSRTGGKGVGAEEETESPDIYHFSSLGLDLSAHTRETPFIPSMPRVAENQVFNFDHGALDAGMVEETSYMAWF